MVYTQKMNIKYVLATLIPFPILKYHVNLAKIHCSWDWGLEEGISIGISPVHCQRALNAAERARRNPRHCYGIHLGCKRRGKSFNVGVLLILFCVLAQTQRRPSSLNWSEMSVHISEPQAFHSVASQREWEVLRLTGAPFGAQLYGAGSRMNCWPTDVVQDLRAMLSDITVLECC